MPPYASVPVPRSAVSVELRFLIASPMISSCRTDSPEDFDAAFAAIGRARPDAIFCADSPVNLGTRQRIIDIAARQRLPAVHALRAFAESGELPIEQPTKFELIVNLKTARALGLTIPQSVLLRTDEVIQ